MNARITAALTALRAAEREIDRAAKALAAVDGLADEHEQLRQLEGEVRRAERLIRQRGQLVPTRLDTRAVLGG